MSKKIYLIVAVAENGVIGKDNDLVWRIKEDMAFFKQTTTGHIILSGRKNYESIPPQFRPLPKRLNCVLTRNKDYNLPEECPTFSSIESWINKFQDDERDLFIIGGGQVFKEALDKNLVDVIYYTEVKGSPEGDVFFPSVNFDVWSDEVLLRGEKNETNQYGFIIHRYTKK